MMRTLIYDGQCRLCVTAKKGLERLGPDPDVQFVPYQSEEAECRLGGLSGSCRRITRTCSDPFAVAAPQTRL